MMQRERISDAPITFDGMHLMDANDVPEFNRDDFDESPTFEYAVQIEGRSLGELEAHFTSEAEDFALQDPGCRDKKKQVEQTLGGYATEIAVIFLADELGVPVKWLKDSGGYSGDALLMPDGSESYSLEIKSCQMSSAGQNLPHRGDYDETPEEAWVKEGIKPDVIVFGYTVYTGSEIIVGIEGVEPLAKELNGLLSREPRSMSGGKYWLYDRRFIRHSFDSLDNSLLEKLKSL